MILLLAASVFTFFYSNGQTDIFKLVEYGTSLQNSTVLVDEANDYVFLGTYKNTVLAFDKTSGSQLWSQDIGGAVSAMVYDDEKQLLAVGSQDRNVYIYDAATGENVNTFSVNGKVYDLDYDQATDRLLVSAGVNASKHTLYVLDINTGDELNVIKLKHSARAAKFTADKQNIVFGDARSAVQIIDLEGEKLYSAKMRGEIYSLRVADNGDIVIVDESCHVNRYTSTLEELFAIELVGEGRQVGISSDGRWIGVGSRQGDVYILDAEGNTQFANRYANDISQMYFGTDSSYVVTLSTELYEFSTKKLDSIGTMAVMNKYAIIASIAFLLLSAAFLICTFPRSRDCAKRFFRSIYRHRTAYLMLLPSIVLILVFNYYNVFQAFYYAFTDWSIATRTMREVEFIGFSNFVKMITEGYFLLGVKNLLILMVTSFLKLLTVPVLLAELVFAMRTLSGESSKRRYWFRLFLVMPMVVPGVVSALMWKNIYDPNIGALNSILDVVGLGNLKHSWLGDEKTALGSIIMMGFPFVNSFAFLVLYGGLINIPGELFEAAKVDGSNPWWNFWHIHLPLLSPQLKMLIITTFIGSVQDYGGIYLLTQGGPGTSTYVPGLELYFAATKFGQYGYACAMGIVMFIVILIGSLINLRMKTQEIN